MDDPELMAVGRSAAPADADGVRAYVGLVIRWRWLVLLSVLALAAVCISGVRFLELEGDYRYHFTPTNPELVAFEHIEQTYTRVDNILFVLVTQDGDVFTSDTLEAVLWLTAQGWQIPHAIRVDSLSNFQHTTAAEDDLIVADLIGRDSAGLDRQSLTEIRRTALSEPQLVGRLLAADAGATGVNVTIRLPVGGGDEGEPARYASELATQLERDHPGLRVAVTGSIPLIYAMMDTPQRDAATLVPMMYLVLLAAMFVFLRTFWAVLGLLLMIGLAAASAMGAAGWLGIPLSPPMGSATTIILTIAVADGVHILVLLNEHMRAGIDRHSALVESLAVNWFPVFMTTLTTVIGFLSLNFAGIPPFSDLGNVTAIGVGVAWILTVTLLPAFVAIVPYRPGSRSTAGVRADRYTAWLLRHHRRILPLTLGLTLICAALIPTIELDDSFIDFFDKSVPFRADSELALEKLSGIYQLHYSLEAGVEGGVSDPAYLRSIAEFALWLRGQPEVDHVSTLSDTIKRLNRNMHADADAAYVLPADRELAAQYLLLYEMSLPYGLDLNNQIDVRKSATRVTATVGNLSAAELRAFNVRVMDWLRAHTPPSMHVSGASASFMLANLSLRSIDSMVRGTSVAFALIALILVLSLRSLRIGLLSLVPNLVPIVIAYGIWAIVVGEIGMVFAIVTASSLGIIVDATVHIMSKYMRARRVLQASPEEAVQFAIATVGPALLTTFLILAAGFVVLSMSTFKLNEDFGLLTALTILAALVADFLLLPALLLRVDRAPRASSAPTRTA